MKESITFPPVFRVLVISASFVIVVMGMQAAKAILVPFFLAFIIAVLFSPPLAWLQRKGVPKWLSMVLISLLIVVIGIGLATYIGTSVARFARSLPRYEERMERQQQYLTRQLEELGIDLSTLILPDMFNADSVMQAVGYLLSGLGGALTNSFLVIFMVIFMLLESSSIPMRMKAAFGEHDQTMEHFRKLSEGIKNYLIIKTWLSLATGVSVAIWLLIMGVEFPILWGLVAFLFNFIPNIGSIIAAIPACIIAFVQRGVIWALVVAVGYVLINSVISYVIEPRFMGLGLNLSILVVFLSLVFWGWVFGPVGLILSLPLTVLVKIALENNENTRWLAILLGSERYIRQEAPQAEPSPSPLPAERSVPSTSQSLSNVVSAGSQSNSHAETPK